MRRPHDALAWHGIAGKPNLKVAPRLLGASVSASLGEHVLAHHRSMGTEVQIGVRIEGFETQEGQLLSMQVNGNRVALDELVLGIGSVPETRLGADCGLAVDNGDCGRHLHAHIRSVGSDHR